MPSDNQSQRMIRAIRQATEIGLEASRILSGAHAVQVQKVLEIGQRVAQITDESAARTTELLRRLDKAGFTPNLGDSSSVRKLKKYQRLLEMGYAIFWVPRAEIIDRLVSAKNETERKRIVSSCQKDVLDDCANVLATISDRYLLNYRYHIESAIVCMRDNNIRGAQSTASVALDAQLDQIIDISSMKRYSEMNNNLNKQITALKNIDEIPIQFVYAALQSRLIIYFMKIFNRLEPTSVRAKYNRHSSIHTVSARQYTLFNAVQSIMIATSLLATTSKLGKGWLTSLARYV